MASNANSATSSFPGRRRRRQEFLLPDGRKVIVTMPEEYNSLREEYSTSDCNHVEVVLHGSDEHHKFLRGTHDHHQDRHRRMTERHGREVLEELLDIQDQLNIVKAEMDRLNSNSSSDNPLSHNFSKFGYHAALRTYDDESSSRGASMSELGSDKTAASWEDPRPGSTVKLFKRPVIKQWLHRGLLWRASEHTEIMAVELFFDLLYGSWRPIGERISGAAACLANARVAVGIIHTNGEHVSEAAGGKELLRFVITFIMSWNIWSDVTRYVSWFETDDVTTQVLILFDIVCLLGLTTNMTYALSDDHSTWTPLVAFYLAARLKNAVTHTATGFALPMIKSILLLNALFIFIPSVLWIGSIYVSMPVRLGLVFPALAIDVYDKSIIFAMFAWSKRYEQTSVGRSLGKVFEFFPAINIEHRVERTNAFVSLVLGYSVVGVMFQSHGSDVFSAFLGKAILGLIQAFLFNWIYFDIDANNLHVHAIRRSAMSAGLWSFAHLPFVMSYILATAAMSKLVLTTDIPNADASTLGSHYSPLAEPEVTDAIRLIYCYGLGITLLSMNLISLSHEHRQPPNLRWKKPHRLANRVLISFIYFGLPWAKNLTSQSLIAISMSLILDILLVELWGTSCPDDPFIGERDGVCVRYRSYCCKRELKRALKEEEEKHPENFRGMTIPDQWVEEKVRADAAVVDKNESTVVPEEV